MARRSSDGPSPQGPYLDLFSHGRRGPSESLRLSHAQIDQIRRTVRRAPEVMVKVTGGGRRTGAVAAHFAYISHQGELEIETDEGQRVSKDGQKELLKSWHLELSAGQYRPSRGDKAGPPDIKLVHNITLSMPAATSPKAVLAAARVFARENFGATHRYALALHTHQRHPHVHLVVKAEGLDGRRLHIDKAMLREWCQDFAQRMREQGIEANATPRAVRGQTRRAGKSYVLREELDVIVRELSATKTIADPARARLLKTRKDVIAGWNSIVATLEAQGEIALGGDVRYFANHLPPVLTDRERLAMKLFQITKERTLERRSTEPLRERAIDRVR